MSRIFINGWGAISPAGWGTRALREALAKTAPIATKEFNRPGWPHAMNARRVPALSARPAFAAHARLRRTSPIAQFAVGAALEALGQQAPDSVGQKRRLGVIFCSMTGCVNFSQRFYDETLKDPATASPLVFPETVFNAPASHLAAMLGTNEINYTLVGDPGTYLQGLALAADWLTQDRIDGCLVVGAEEFDWLISEAFHLFSRQATIGEGSGALYLTRKPGTAPSIELEAVTSPQLFLEGGARRDATAAARAQLGATQEHSLLCDSAQGVTQLDADEAAVWADWQGARFSPKRLLGEGFMAAAAWQCVAAVDELSRNGCAAADVSVVGCNQQAIAARFRKS